MLTVNQLKTWLHKDFGNTEKILIALASFNKPCSIKELKCRAKEAGLKIPVTWNVSLMLSRSKGLAINTPQGWELTNDGRKAVQELGVKVVLPFEATEDYNLVDLLHPTIVKSSLKQYRNNHFRDAVLNGTLALGDLIRERTGFSEDGDQLITKTFSPGNPKLVVSEVTTLSGQNDQKGFMFILQGVMTGVRNPKAHSLITDIYKAEAAQYLVFLSLLAKRISDAKLKS